MTVINMIIRNSKLQNKLDAFISGDDLAGSKSHIRMTFTNSNSAALASPASSQNAATGNSESSNTRNRFDQSIRQILMIDDDLDSAIAIRSCLESYREKDTQGSEFQVLEVTMFSDPVMALAEFKPYYYDLLLVDINMPILNGYDLVEKITRLDLNIKVCFMSSGEVNYEAIQEIRHHVKSFGCFIKKPATRDHLINRVINELF